MKQMQTTNRFMGQAFIKVRKCIVDSKKQHYESLRNLVQLYLKKEAVESNRNEIKKLYYDKLDAAQW